MQDLANIDRLDAHLATINDPADAAQLARDFRGLETALGNRREANLAVLGYAKAARRAGELLARVPRESRKRTDLSGLHGVTQTSYQDALAKAQLDVATAHRWQALTRIERERWDEWCRHVEDGHDAALNALLRPSATPSTKATQPLPEGEFRVVYADPPWRYDFAETRNREIEQQYYTLDIDELRGLEDSDGRHVRSLGAEDSVLFLWATNPKLEEAIALVEAWGFEYRTNLVWVKDRIGMGYYARQRHELLLIGKRGEPPMPEPSERPDSVIEAPRLEHSRKPDVVYSLIERMFDGPYVELFARGSREGWVPWPESDVSLEI